MIKLENVSKSFGDKVILDGISVQFERGKTNIIIGPSGSGKTVLLKSVVGLYDIDGGQIIYGDVVFSSLNIGEKREIRKQIGMLFQGGALFDSINVEENVMFPLDMFTEYSIEEKRDRVNFCLKRVKLENANSLFPSELSGGMKKRVAIARAISLNPKYLFCDEPNSGLDPKTSIVIDNLIKEITEEFDITTVVNTHDMNSVMEIGDKVIFIHHGEKAWEGTKDDILHTNHDDLNDFIFASPMSQRLRKFLGR